MIILGKSRVVATTVALALASSLSLTLTDPASAQTAAPAAAPAKPAAPAAAAPGAGAAAKPAAAPAAPAVGAAAGKQPDAKGLFASGEKKFKANDFAGALADFEASQTAKADPATGRYIALSQDNLGHFTEAVAAYEKFIAENPPK